MKKYILTGLAVMVLLTLTMAVSAVDFDSGEIQGLNVTTDVDGAFSLAQSQNKTVAIIFDQDSCVYCDMLKDNVLSDKNVQKELNEKCIVLLVDINKNPQTAGKYQVFGTPVVHFVDGNGKTVQKIEGYVESDEFLSALKEI